MISLLIAMLEYNACLHYYKYSFIKIYHAKKCVVTAGKQGVTDLNAMSF